jgi:hypothetical protein
MMSVLTLALMIVLVATLPRAGRPASKPTPTRPKGDTLILGRGVKVGPPEYDPHKPGKVTYELLKDKRLPSPTQLMLKRMFRPVMRAYRAVVPAKPDAAPGRRTRQSAELQNFLDARNKEIARRKAESDLKRGPEDQLH